MNALQLLCLFTAVTGSTDGIGKQYASELASRGLNVVLISRSQEKLNAVASEIGKLRARNTRFDCLLQVFPSEGTVGLILRDGRSCDVPGVPGLRRQSLTIRLLVCHPSHKKNAS